MRRRRRMAPAGQRGIVYLTDACPGWGGDLSCVQEEGFLIDDQANPPEAAPHRVSDT